MDGEAQENARAYMNLNRVLVRRFAIAPVQGQLGQMPKDVYNPFDGMRQNAMLRLRSRRPSQDRRMGTARLRWRSPRRAAAMVALIIVASLTFVAALSDILVDWAWFSALGYLNIFWIVLITKVSLFTTVLVASAAVLLTNGWLALGLTKGPPPFPAQLAWQPVPGVTSLGLWGRAWGRLSAAVVGAAVIFSGLIAWANTGQWDPLLRFLFQVPFAQSDPMY